MNKKRYNVVGYGSLVSHKSLKQTIPDKKFKLVIVQGYKRIFNLEDKGGDYLNIEKSPGSKFNGVLFSVDEEEFKKLVKRELEYNLEEEDVFDFKTGKKIGKAFVFIDYFFDIDPGRMFPEKRYFALCREAAYHISEKFGKFWDETTFTSEGEKIRGLVKKKLI